MRKEKELTSTVRLPAEAESFRVETLAEGNRTQTVEVARANAEKIKSVGAAEATAIEAVGKAEAERMRMKAAAYKQYGDAAKMSLILEALPQVAAEVAAPLGKVRVFKPLFYMYLCFICIGDNVVVLCQFSMFLSSPNRLKKSFFWVATTGPLLKSPSLFPNFRLPYRLSQAWIFREC